MFRTRRGPKHLIMNKRAISSLAIILIVVIVAGAIVAGTVVWWFWPFRGHVVGSGNLVTEDYNYSDFTGVDVESGFEVEITQSSSYSTNITTDDNMLDYVEVSSPGNKLTISLKWGYSYQDVTLRAKIIMPDLHELEFSGGTIGNVEGFTSSHDFALSLSGGSTISLEGAANDLTISGSGGSLLHLSDFPVHNATVNLSGGSDATINLDGRLAGNLSGGSHLKYVGNPTAVVVNTSGGSTVGPQ